MCSMRQGSRRGDILPRLHSCALMWRIGRNLPTLEAPTPIRHWGHSLGTGGFQTVPLTLFGPSCASYMFLKHATLCDKLWNCLSGIYPACQEVQLHIPALHEQLQSFYMQNLGRFSVLIVCWQGLSGRACGRCAVLCWGGNASCGQPVHASCFGDR